MTRTTQYMPQRHNSHLLLQTKHTNAHTLALPIWVPVSPHVTFPMLLHTLCMHYVAAPCSRLQADSIASTAAFPR